MFRGKSIFSDHKKRGRPPSANPRKLRKVFMTDSEWSALLARCEQLGTKPGETIGILTALS